MKELFIFTWVIVLLFSCSQDNMVQISGRVENGDSIVSIWVEDSIYTFPLDENDSFSGKIQMRQSGYATFLHNSLNLYLSPGENLEIYVNALNFLGSLYFRGSLGGINSYLKEQESAVFFDKDYYALGEKEFVQKMKELIDEKTKLLEAKNFNESFTRLEKERIRYSVAERVSFYPIYRNRIHPAQNYRPGVVFSEFLSSFSLNDEDLFGAKDYRSFLLNYVYLQGTSRNNTRDSYSDGIVDYILSTVNNSTIKNFLLTEIVFHHIRENNGLNGADYLLSVFRREVTEPNKVAYMEEVISHWDKLLPGNPAPSFSVRDQDGNEITLEQFRGNYLYITVWATWCVPCKSELPYLDLLQKEYLGRKISFLTIAIDDFANQKQWKNFLAENLHAGLHTFADAKNEFNKDYMIISVPRFILLGPDGKIIDSNAPRPSGQIRPLLDELEIGITNCF
ncbi:TlpA family protein disulfide reductase [Bacteroides acidifaciens]|uniref:TlpA family protein disulfide reductase n=1 Tax=Bacteroides acidifaciens TaxID=85831 RepID=UPI002676406E|nr:TlpA disulfide reductase family protein [Bacteroides acidifaciens]